MVATETIVLYTDDEIIAEVYEGETYLIPNGVKVFVGTIDEFVKEKHNYNFKPHVEIQN